MSEPAGTAEGDVDRGRSRLLRGYGLVLLVTVVVLVAVFVVAEALDLAVLSDPAPWLEQGGPTAAFVGVALLVADVVIPAPSSVVMVAHGSLFGVPLGAALSLLGATAATLVAFWIGRRGRGFLRVAADAADDSSTRRLVERYGAVAIVATRPIPILAEAVAVVAGTTPMRWRTAIVGGVAGNLVPAVVYAYAGSRAATVADQALILGGVVVLSLLLLPVGRRLAG